MEDLTKKKQDIIKIRKAENSDIELIIPIMLEISKLHEEGRPDIFKEKTRIDAEKELKDKVNSGISHILVCNINEATICGILIYRVKYIENHNNLKDTKILWIEEVGVNEKYRRQGIGSRLIKEVRNIARKEGCSRVELNCWCFNENAIKFYKKIGMKEQRINMEI